MGILAICGVLAIGISMYKLRMNVRDPFLVPKSELAAIKKIVGTSPQEDAAKQKRTDTDGDSLSDWDETNLYKTNPNLRDSCGDGMPDNLRVATGKNLRCVGPAGTEAPYQVATGSSAVNGLYPSFMSGNISEPSIIQGVLPQSSGSATQGQTMPRDAKVIRESLVGRVDQAKLDQLTDEQLLQLYDEAIAIQTSGAAQTTATATKP